MIAYFLPKYLEKTKKNTTFAAVQGQKKEKTGGWEVIVKRRGGNTLG